MNSQTEQQNQVFALMRQYGMSSVLLRNAVSRKLGLNITDMECLSLLAIKGFATPTELAKYTRMTSGAATTMLDRLEKAQLITRKPNPSDRRGVIIEVNKEAMQKNAALFAGAQVAQRKILARYSKAELQTIADFLERVSEAITCEADVVSKG